MFPAILFFRSANNMTSKYYIQGGKSYFDFAKGYRAIISPISPGLMIAVRANRPEPAPPVIKVPVGDGTFMEESNAADPGYKATYEAWQIEVEKDMATLFIELGAVAESIDIQALEKTENFMRTRFGIELEGDQNFKFLKYVAPSSEEEYNAFLVAIGGRSAPEERAIASAIESFSSPL